MQHSRNIHIVIVGSGDLSIATYQSLVKKMKAEIKNGQLQITVISSSENYECCNLIAESISNIIQPETLCTPLLQLMKHATIIKAAVINISARTNEITIGLADGTIDTISYNHLVLDQQSTSISRSDIIPGFTFSLTNLSQANAVKQQLQLLVKNAAAARNELVAKNGLRIILVADGVNNLSIANGIVKYLSLLCGHYYSLQQVKPQLTLISAAQLCVKPKQYKAVQQQRSEQLKTAGIDWVEGTQLARICPEGAVMENGSFIAGNMIIFTNEIEIPLKGTYAFERSHTGAIATDKFLRVSGQSFIWCQDKSNQLNSMHPSNLQKQGWLIGSNIALAIGCRFLKSYNKKAFAYSSSHLLANKNYLLQKNMLANSGIARHLHLLSLLLAMPANNMRKIPSTILSAIIYGKKLWSNHGY